MLLYILCSVYHFLAFLSQFTSQQHHKMWIRKVSSPFDFCHAFHNQFWGEKYPSICAPMCQYIFAHDSSRKYFHFHACIDNLWHNRKRLISFTSGSPIKVTNLFGQQFHRLCSHMPHLSSFCDQFPTERMFVRPLSLARVHKWLTAEKFCGAVGLHVGERKQHTRELDVAKDGKSAEWRKERRSRFTLPIRDWNLIEAPLCCFAVLMQPADNLS